LIVIGACQFALAIEQLPTGSNGAKGALPALPSSAVSKITA
jgi:hypothetical protein